MLSTRICINDIGIEWIQVAKMKVQRNAFEAWILQSIS